MQIKKVVSGVFLIILSLALGLAAFYQWEVKPELASRQEVGQDVSSSDIVTADNKAEQKKVVIPLNNQKEVQSVKPEEVAVKEVSTETKEELAGGKEDDPKTQGFLWINRKSSKYVVTLGKKNGLEVGTTLLVYQGEEKLGKIEVDTVFDTIAYVHPIDISAELSEGDYYRVIPQ